MNKLIIAEKPMLARDIARVMCGREGKMPVSGNGYTVVSCAGHLLELMDPASIKQEYGKWDLSLLPIKLRPWPKAVSKGKHDLIKIIKNELTKCDGAINAGDPDDEGQLIVDEVLDWLKYKGRVERVYISDSVDKNIKKAFSKLKDNNDCRKDGDSALARQIADFAFGINESRLAGLKTGHRVSVGRVQTPTLGLIVNRDRAIENHTTEDFYELIGNYTVDNEKVVPFKFIPDEELLDDDKYIKTKSKLEEIEKKLPEEFSINLNKKTKKESAPLPFNLTVLQSEMSKRYGYSAKETLNITQDLRDKHKAITYNRTDCQYLSSEHYKEAKNVASLVMKNLGEESKWKLDFSLKHRAFNDKNISAHHGIIPQEIKLDISKMNPKELNVYKSICYRYFRLFLEDAVIEEVSGFKEIECGKLELKLTKTIKAGWKSKKDIKDDPVFLNDGQYTFYLDSSNIETKQTKPPKRYTEGTLISDMASIAKYCTDPEIKEILKRKDKDKKGEHGGIGTTATRADIIERLKKRGFIELSGKQIISTQFGREFYDLVPNDIKTADVTAKWWLIQEEIAEGKRGVYDLMDDVIRVFESHKNTAYKNAAIEKKSDPIVGKCPICGEDVLNNGKIIYCSSNKSKKQGNKWVEIAGCGFKMFGSIAKKKLTKTQIQKLLSGATIDMNNLKSKTGKTFSAKIRIKTNKGVNDFAETEFLFGE